MADGMDEGAMEEGTYTKGKSTGNNGGVVDELRSSASKKKYSDGKAGKGTGDQS